MFYFISKNKDFAKQNKVFATHPNADVNADMPMCMTANF